VCLFLEPPHSEHREKRKAIAFTPQEFDLIVKMFYPKTGRITMAMEKAYLFSRARSSGLIDGPRGSVLGGWLCASEQLPPVDRM
jgi:hypothetical protein